MKLTLSRQEMLKRRRLAAGLEPLRTDCTVELTEGLDVDRMLLDGLRKWYLTLLDTAPREMLAPDHIRSNMLYPVEGKAGGVRIMLPAACRRVFDLKLQHWSRPAPVLPRTELDTVVSRQLNPYTAATCDRPVAVYVPGAEGADAVYAWPAGAGAKVETLCGVLDPGEEAYVLDESALALMPTDSIPTLTA